MDWINWIDSCRKSIEKMCYYENLAELDIVEAKKYNEVIIQLISVRTV